MNHGVHSFRYSSFLIINTHTRMSVFVDPVARFHLRNGASLHRVNWDACVEDPKLMAQSGGTHKKKILFDQ